MDGNMSQSAWNRGREMLVRYWQRLAAGYPWVIAASFVVITALFFVKGNAFKTLASYEMPPTTAVGNVTGIWWLDERKVLIRTKDKKLFYLDSKTGGITAALDDQRIDYGCYLKGGFIAEVGEKIYILNSQGENLISDTEAYSGKTISIDMCVLIDKTVVGLPKGKYMAASSLELFPGIRIVHGSPDGFDLFYLHLDHQGYGLKLTSRFYAIEFGEFDQRWMLVNKYTANNGAAIDVPPDDFDRYIMLVDKNGIFRSYRPVSAIKGMKFTRLEHGIVAYAGGPGKGMYLVTDNGGVLKTRRISNQYYEAAAADPSGCLLAASVRVAVNGLPEYRGVSQIKIYDFCQP